MPWVVHEGVGEAMGVVFYESILVDHGRDGKGSCKYFGPFYPLKGTLFY